MSSGSAQEPKQSNEPWREGATLRGPPRSPLSLHTVSFTLYQVFPRTWYNTRTHGKPQFGEIQSPCVIMEREEHTSFSNNPLKKKKRGGDGGNRDTASTELILSTEGSLDTSWSCQTQNLRFHGHNCIGAGLKECAFLSRQSRIFARTLYLKKKKKQQTCFPPGRDANTSHPTPVARTLELKLPRTWESTDAFQSVSLHYSEFQMFPHTFLHLFAVPSPTPPRPAEREGCSR